MADTGTSGSMPALAAKANEDKTVALVATCSFMLSLALGLRLLGWYLAKTRRRRKRLQLVPGLDLYLPFPVALHALDVSVFVVLWYAVSIGMTLFNKWFLRVWAGGGYPFATTMTCINMFVKCALSRLIDRCASSGGSRAGAARARVLASGRAHRPVHGARHHAVQPVLYGFVLVLAASVIGTLRWVLTQSLLQAMEDNSRNKVLAVVYFVSPASAVGLLPIALFSEASDYATSRFLLDSQLLLMSLVFIFISGCLAFVLIFIEIMLVKKTSALSLGIAGSFKDVTQVLLAVFIFGDQLIAINVFGLVVATCGMLFYTFIKHTTAEAASDARRGKLKGYQRVPSSHPDLEGGSDVQCPDSDSSKHHIVPEFHMKDERGVLASGTKTLSSVSGVELVRRKSKEYFSASSMVSSASHG
ncbi:hypothetical protein PF010_g20078 [Phytophthora fragariae]|uniref:Sugar phosphate transporter domain-containing protein n=2 Tax=Phytophthora fragariae TaxID=53985 RepID=A0A6G0KFT8_9STRA|nr:hypothetical protein PF010_g20078 [Phytophthora fragariae]